MEKIAQFYKVSEEQFINDWRAATGSSIEEAKSVYANIRLPRRATKGSAGYDFFAPESFTLVPHETILIPTGIRVMIEDGWVLQLYPRSGLGFRHRLQLDNTVGVIDSDYRGEINVVLHNHGSAPQTIENGERVAQLLITPVLQPAYEIAETLTDTARNAGGFGSTGK